MNKKEIHEILNKKGTYINNGFTGTIVGYCVYNYGDITLLIDSVDSTGRPMHGWYDIRCVEIENENGELEPARNNYGAPHEQLD